MLTIICKNSLCNREFLIYPCRIGRISYCSQECRELYGTHKQKYFAKFWSGVSIGKPNECWPWKLGKTKAGYGKFSFFIKEGKRKTVNAHVYAFAYPLHLNGGRQYRYKLCVCHTCDNPPCCNPAHLFLGTPKDNVEDRDKKGRTAFGIRHGMTKYSTETILLIRQMALQGASTVEIMSKTGLGYGYIRSIVNKRRRKKVA